jgi:hypothetical protein
MLIFGNAHTMLRGKVLRIFISLHYTKGRSLDAEVNRKKILGNSVKSAKTAGEKTSWSYILHFGDVPNCATLGKRLKLWTLDSDCSLTGLQV